ncbi:hypothetical protein AB0D08_26740 [Kitasatospora sp. NPDC048540]|uniref:WXG100-like domain-containing protein n=1 Tax=Kitasatospora sp. NPDC048540 TaxID=3155634 RepID=UPI0033D9BBD1
MAIELPGEFVWVMNLIGLNWPQVNEDEVREFADHIRDFASNIDSTHMAVSETIRQMGEAYQAASYEVLVQRWAAMSSDHMTEIVEVCHAAGTVLDVAADAIVAAKLAVIAELGVMAVEFVATQAAAVATLGAAEAAEALLIEATKRVVNALLQQLEDQIIGELMEQMCGPLEAVVERALSGLVFQGVEAALGPAGGGPAGDGFRIHPEELLKHAQALHGHSDEMAGHAQRFVAATEGMTFE